MSCNGCRVLRKGCSENCILRPCLQWIDTPESQGHATVFVAKFFGRAGLMSFISNVPHQQRPALFQSLLYEACGRTVNPVSGAVGLLWTGNWHVCQAAVDTVLRGGTLRPISPVPTTNEGDDASEVVCSPQTNTWRNQIGGNLFQEEKVKLEMFPQQFTNINKKPKEELDLSLTPPEFLNLPPQQRPCTPSLNSEESAVAMTNLNFLELGCSPDLRYCAGGVLPPVNELFTVPIGMAEVEETKSTTKASGKVGSKRQSPPTPSPSSVAKKQQVEVVKPSNVTLAVPGEVPTAVPLGSETVASTPKPSVEEAEKKDASLEKTPDPSTPEDEEDDLEKELRLRSEALLKKTEEIRRRKLEGISYSGTALGSDFSQKPSSVGTSALQSSEKVEVPVREYTDHAGHYSDIYIITDTSEKDADSASEKMQEEKSAEEENDDVVAISEDDRDEDEVTSEKEDTYGQDKPTTDDTEQATDSTQPFDKIRMSPVLETWAMQKWGSENPTLVSSAEAALGLIAYLAADSYNKGLTCGNAKVIDLEAKMAKLEETQIEPDALKKKLSESEDLVRRLTSQVGDLDSRCKRADVALAKQKKEIDTHYECWKAADSKIKELTRKLQNSKNDHKNTAHKLEISENLAENRATELKEKEAALDRAQIEVEKSKKKVVDTREKYRTLLRQSGEVEQAKFRRCFYWAYPDLDWGKVEEMKDAGKENEDHPAEDAYLASHAQ